MGEQAESGAKIKSGPSVKAELLLAAQIAEDGRTRTAKPYWVFEGRYPVYRLQVGDIDEE